MPDARRVHDCLINVHFGDEQQAEYMHRVKNEYFKRADSIFDPWDMASVLDEMDANGVERAVLTADVRKPGGSPYKFVEARPDRFSLALGGLDLLKPMPTLRTLQSMVADYPVTSANVGPAFWGDGRYNPEDAVYFPLYTKCAELELPLCMNTGLPGPPIPGEAQNPIYLDRVCVRFPELKLCMIHGADPWWDTAIRLLGKYPNLRLMTSAWAPKYLPESLLHFMRTRGKTKVIFASDAPVLSITRTVGEATKLYLPPEVMDNYLYGNAEAFFFQKVGGSA
ncbi:amidohydrolase family protein [Cryptosporangium aurantiacum]|uniref:Predicted metal-dependent hydrolase, TIM-barrel fold n=1 Tax=Cryptosporangium aurantiacum TaxID=134849 RepID=A0A1M7R3B7_9ACTN|nr:amidohydrolase family protein [Cryptosporangium aurantiacum]SHN39329.1 Predicted metal-dependent hydrolase, TIM-barrel fold [Cryptosporangium aurantiacum]